MEYGIQLYSVRDLSSKSLDEALRQVAEYRVQVRRIRRVL